MLLLTVGIAFNAGIGGVRMLDGTITGNPNFIYFFYRCKASAPKRGIRRQQLTVRNFSEDSTIHMTVFRERKIMESKYF